MEKPPFYEKKTVFLLFYALELRTKITARQRRSKACLCSDAFSCEKMSSREGLLLLFAKGRVRVAYFGPKAALAAALAH